MNYGDGYTNNNNKPIKHQVEKKIPGGKYIKLSLIVSNDLIKNIVITGDFFIYPEDFIESLEEKLKGIPTNPEQLAKVLDDHHKTFYEPVDFIGIEYEDIKSLIFECINDATTVSNAI